MSPYRIAPVETTARPWGLAEVWLVLRYWRAHSNHKHRQHCDGLYAYYGWGKHWFGTSNTGPR